MSTVYITTLNNSFIQGALITINTLLKCCKSTSEVKILYWEEITDYNKQLLSKICSNIKYQKIKTEDYPPAQFDINHRKWEYNCHYRYDIFDAEADRVVYFDCDIIFNTVLEELLSFNVDIGAVYRPPGTIVQIGDRSGFDAGILTIGKKYLNRKTKLELIQLSQQPSPIDRYIKSSNWVGNEPVLNTFFNNASPLPTKFNLCTDVIDSNNIDEPNNIQFIGHKKPWSGTEVSEQFDEYIINKIVKNNGKFYSEIILKKLLKIYNRERVAVESLVGVKLNDLKNNR
jgi:lipopolysaccharide biosynthesis glycosyltransferase